MKLEEIQLIKTNPADWDSIKYQILEIEEKVFEADARFKEEDLKDTFINEKSINFLAYHESNPVGYCMGEPAECLSILNFDEKIKDFKTFYIESVAVISGYRRIRLGEELIKKTVEECAKRKYERVTSHGTAENMIKVYEKLQFVKSKFFEKWIGDRDAWYMEKIL